MRKPVPEYKRNHPPSLKASLFDDGCQPINLPETHESHDRQSRVSHVMISKYEP